MGASAPIFKGLIMPNTKATGVAYLDPEFTTCYATEEIGYAAAAQGTVTQATSKSTGVTLSKSSGRITMNGAELAANTAVSFTLTNTSISANDTIIVCISGGATAAAYTTYISSLASGSAVITLRNLTGGALSEAVIINFAIIHGAS
jgi:1-aminocyclopropane-1-carboxylate deaminase/D-cysteine desulfhydrase-like pyridoxal-dependent ACC family enzyme